jgi:hypothetical protein
MDRFERLLDGEATDFERALLDSASDDSPSHRVRARTLAAMGVGASVAGAAQAAHAATKLAATGATAGASKGAGTVSLVMLLKWVGTGALAGSVVAAGVATVTTPGVVFPKHRESNVATTAPAPTAKAQPAKPSPPIAAPAAVAAVPGPRPEPARSVAVLPPKTEKLVAPTPPELPPPASAPVAAPVWSTEAAPVSPPAAPSSAIVAEVEALDHARSALAAGDPRAALALVRKHDAAFPAGVLGPEAVVLRVRALVALGDREQASAVAAGFMASHPNSAQAARLSAIVSGR